MSIAWNDPAGEWDAMAWGRPVSGIRFVQFLLPDGRKQPVWIDRPADVERLAMALTEHGARFEIEMLRTGEISMTCEIDDDLVSQELCTNGPEVPDAVDQLVRNSARRLLATYGGDEA